MTVTVLVPEHDHEIRLTDQEQAHLAEAIAEADRGEGTDEWRLLEELKG